MELNEITVGTFCVPVHHRSHSHSTLKNSRAQDFVQNGPALILKNPDQVRIQGCKVTSLNDVLEVFLRSFLLRHCLF